MDNALCDKALFSSAYAGSVRYYAAMLACSKAVGFDGSERVGHHSWIHNHCRIVGANGVQALAIPVEKPSARCYTVRDMRISEHGDWRRIHWGAIFSAYGKSPFFEYIATDLQALYERGDHWLLDFNTALHELIVDFLALPIKTENVGNGSTDIAAVDDFRGRIGEKKPDGIIGINDEEYYQIWAPKHGFIPDLSIIDLLMNTGRESIFTLLDMTRNFKS